MVSLEGGRGVVDEGHLGIVLVVGSEGRRWVFMLSIICLLDSAAAAVVAAMVDVFMLLGA